jgi:hypothetical protein
VTAAPASVCEENDSPSTLGNGQVAAKSILSGLKLDVVVTRCRVRRQRRSSGSESPQVEPLLD